MAKKVLLADDSITIQKVVSLTLSSGEYEVTIVGDGDSAIQKAGEISPNIILADVAMPGKNGYEVCEAVKSNPATAHVPVLLLSGTFDPLNESEAQRVKADGNVVKPFESEALIEQIEALMGGAGAAPVAAQPAAPAPVAPTPAAPVAPAPVAPAPVAPAPAAPVAPAPTAPPSATDDVWSSQDFSGQPAAPADNNIPTLSGDMIEEAPEAMELTEGDLIQPVSEETEAAPPPEALNFGDAPAAPAPTTAPPAPTAPIETPPAGGGLDFSGFEDPSIPTEAEEQEASVSEPTIQEEAGAIDFTDMAPAAAPAADPMDFGDIDTNDPLAGGVQAPTPTAHPEDDFLTESSATAAHETVAEPATAPAPVAPAPIAPAPVAPAPVAPAPVAATESFTEKVMAQAALEGITDIGSVDKAQVENLINKVAKEVIEEVAWEVIPEMAEDMIKSQIVDKVKKAMSS